MYKAFYRLCYVFFFVFSPTLKGQADSLSPFYTINKDEMFKPFVVLETWATYSFNESKDNEAYAARSNVYMRRLRFGACGNPYTWLKYSFHLYLDRIGEDFYASTKGSYAGIDLWNAYLTAKLLKSSDLLNLHAGYFWAAISRDFQTSPWAVSAFDKTRATWYLRSFVTGTGNGIESGIGLGGIKNYNNFGLNYRVGVYEPQAYSCANHSNKLYTGRLMFTLGEPEQRSYKYMLSGNVWKQRKGVTIGFGASTQKNGRINDSTCFNHSYTYGTDILIDYNGFRFDAEYFLLNRTHSQIINFNGQQWHIRAAYSVIIWGKYLEPAICYENYQGSGSQMLFKHIGQENTFDIGLNWYMNKDKLKLSVHYVIQQASELNTNTGDFVGAAFQLKL